MRKTGLILAVVFLLIAVVPAMAKPTIVIDAGHGGHDRGGGPGQRVPEKPYTLDIAQRLDRTLRSAGYKTVMTRNGDYFVTLSGRTAISNRLNNVVFVSVHLNSGQREGANGIETYYYSSRSRSLADAIHQRVLRAAGTEDRHVRQRGFYVLRNTKAPAVLCELGFLTNGAESRKILSSSYRQKLAEAVAAGIRAMY